QPFTGRVRRGLDGGVHSAAVTIIAAETKAASVVAVAPEVEQRLRDVFGEHYEHGRHGLCSAVLAQFATAYVAAGVPPAKHPAFQTEIVALELHSGLGWERSGWLLSMAAMNAVAAYLDDDDAAGQP